MAKRMSPKARSAAREHSIFAGRKAKHVVGELEAGTLHTGGPGGRALNPHSAKDRKIGFAIAASEQRKRNRGER